MGQTFYSGTKESERPAVSQLLDDQHLSHQKITLDALHMIPLTLYLIHDSAGVYVVGLKANQANLYRHCVCRSLFYEADYERVDEQTKHHGRVEQRTYRCFRLRPTALAPRWQTTGLATLICVKRHRQQAGVVSQEVSYFVTNSQPASESEVDELFDAIRQHWCVEVMHHKRDVTAPAARTGRRPLTDG